MCIYKRKMSLSCPCAIEGAFPFLSTSGATRCGCLRIPQACEISDTRPSLPPSFAQFLSLSLHEVRFGPLGVVTPHSQACGIRIYVHAWPRNIVLSVV